MRGRDGEAVPGVTPIHMIMMATAGKAPNATILWLPAGTQKTRDIDIRGARTRSRSERESHHCQIKIHHAATHTQSQQTVISSVMLASMSISLALMAVAQPHNVSVTPVDI